MTIVKPTLSLTETFRFVSFVPVDRTKLESGHQRFIAIGKNPGQELAEAEEIRAVEGWYHPNYHPRGYAGGILKGGHIRITQLVPVEEEDGRLLHHCYQLDLEHDPRGDDKVVDTLKRKDPYIFADCEIFPPILALGHVYTRREEGVYEILRRGGGRLELHLQGAGDNVTLTEIKETKGLPSAHDRYIPGDPEARF